MTKFEEVKEALADINPDALFADGFEDALIGIAQQFNTSLACYDRAKCIDILMVRDAMTEEEAEEFFEFNVAGSWVGPNTPIFVVRF